MVKQSDPAQELSWETSGWLPGGGRPPRWGARQMVHEGAPSGQDTEEQPDGRCARAGRANVTLVCALGFTVRFWGLGFSRGRCQSVGAPTFPHLHCQIASLSLCAGACDEADRAQQQHRCRPHFPENPLRKPKTKKNISWSNRQLLDFWRVLAFRPGRRRFLLSGSPPASALPYHPSGRQRVPPRMWFMRLPERVCGKVPAIACVRGDPGFFSPCLASGCQRWQREGFSGG